MRQGFAIASLLCGVAACSMRVRSPPILPQLENDAELRVYVQPFPRDADRLAFRIASIAAVRDDGTEVPLRTALEDVAGAEMTGQRLLAWGRIPTGRYGALAVRVAAATLVRDSQKASLLVPAEPARVEMPFDARRRAATVAWLSFKYAESIDRSFGFSPAFSAVIAPQPAAGVVGYSSDTAMASLTVFDKHAKRVSAVVPTGAAPRGLAIDAGAARVYVALSGQDEIAVVDVASGVELGRIRLRPGDAPRDVAIAADGMLVCVNERSRSVSFLDPDGMVEVARVPVGDDPAALLLDRARRRAYVFNRHSNTISAVDVALRSVAVTAATDPEPLYGQVSRDGSRLYAIHAGSAYMTVFALPALAVEKRVHVGLGAAAIKIDPRTDLIYVGHRGERRLSVYDPVSLLPIDDFDVPDEVSYMAIDETENALFALMPGPGAIAVVDLTSRKLGSVIDVGSEPYRVVLAGERF